MTHPPPATPQAPKGRNVFLDAARTFAAWGVITIHVPYETWGSSAFNKVFWPTCVPFFYVAGLVFFINSAKAGNFRDLLQKQWARLMVPYLCWTLIYITLRLVKGVLTGKPPDIDWLATILYGASAVHLYFLPMLLFFQGLALSIILFGKKKREAAGQGVVVFLVSAAFFAVGFAYGYIDKGRAGYFLAMALYLGAGFLFASRLKKGKLPKSWGVVGLIIWLTAIFMVFQERRLIVMGSPMLLPLGGIGFFLFAASDLIPARLGALAPLLTLSYGIYLSHILFIEIVEFAVGKFAPGQVVYNAPVKVIVTTGIFVASALFTILLPRLIPAAGRLFGESERRPGKA